MHNTLAARKEAEVSAGTGRVVPGLEGRVRVTAQAGFRQLELLSLSAESTAGESFASVLQ